MLTPVAENVWVRESEFLQSNTTIVRGPSGVLLIDPGITESELAALAVEVLELGPVVAGFSTHPDWDHALWHPALGAAPRFATAVGARVLADFLATPDWREVIVDFLPPEHLDEIPLDSLAGLTALPEGATSLPWDGPTVRLIEHRGHAEGHAAALIEHAGVLVAGDMLADTLIPFLDGGSADPTGDYLEGLRRIEEVADAVRLVIPGHGSIGTDVRARIALDRAYVEALRDGRDPADDPRLAPGAPHGEWLPDVHRAQRASLG
ncbi:MBL fold metallo-hydrolase [Schumannella luteola]